MIKGKIDKKGRFVKGMVPWNKGLTGTQPANSGSFKKGERRSKKTEFKKSETTGSKNINWKGDEVGYFALHAWVQRTLGDAKFCENRFSQFLPYRCSKKSNTYHWANRSREYRRDTDDWVELCISCHLTADRRKLPLWLKIRGCS